MLEGCCKPASIARGEVFSTGGSVAQGDLISDDFGVALATRVGFSGAPFSTRPLPEPSTPGFIDGDAFAGAGVEEAD